MQNTKMTTTQTLLTQITADFVELALCQIEAHRGYYKSANGIETLSLELPLTQQRATAMINGLPRDENGFKDEGTFEALDDLEYLLGNFYAEAARLGYDDAERDIDLDNAARNADLHLAEYGVDGIASETDTSYCLVEAFVSTVDTRKARAHEWAVKDAGVDWYDITL